MRVYTDGTGRIFMEVDGHEIALDLHTASWLGTRLMIGVARVALGVPYDSREES